MQASADCTEFERAFEYSTYMDHVYTRIPDASDTNAGIVFGFWGRFSPGLGSVKASPSFPLLSIRLGGYARSVRKEDYVALGDMYVYVYNMSETSGEGW